jgi:hypothetical protein
MLDALAPTAQRFGVIAGAAVAVLCLVYASVLSVGLLTLPSPGHQIQQPWFTLMETLIVAISPAMVALTVALHSWAPQERRSLALASVAFMSMCAVVTCAVHFAILTLSRQSAFTGQAWSRLVFSFQWPSLAYALDILAWDVFFPLAALFAAAAVQGPGLARATRQLLLASSVLAFSGLAGVPLANMQLRNIGIIGYAVLFPIAATMLALLFRRASGQSAA